jgi:hypothetical protein
VFVRFSPTRRVSNAAAGAQGLPNVDPVFTWVRLAQRVPVRIAIDAVPPGVPLVSGMAATVTIRHDSDAGQPTWFDHLRAEVATSLSDVFNGPSARSECIRARADAIAPRDPSLTPEQINPGLAPGLNASPLNVGLPTSHLPIQSQAKLPATDVGVMNRGVLAHSSRRGNNGLTGATYDINGCQQLVSY